MTSRVVSAALVTLVLSSLFLLGGTALALDFGLHLGDDPEALVGHSGLAWAVGAGTVPLAFRWDEVEAVPGRFTWTGLDDAIQAARRYGLRVVGVLYYPESLPPLSRTSRAGWPSAHIDDWDYFVHRVVARYTADIHDWIVVRERGVGGNPFLNAAEAGVDALLAQVTADALHRANPAARLFAAVPGADLRWLSVFAAQGGLRAVDGLALDVNRWPVAPEGLEVVIDDVAAIAADLGYAPALWVWRFGYPTHLGHSWGEPRRAGVDPKEQAAFLVRAHVIAAAAGVDAVIYDELLDRSYDLFQARDNFGLYEHGGEDKPGAFAYMTMTRLLSGLTYASVADWPTMEAFAATEDEAGASGSGARYGDDVGVPVRDSWDAFVDDVPAGAAADVHQERAVDAPADVHQERAVGVEAGQTIIECGLDGAEGAPADVQQRRAAGDETDHAFLEDGQAGAASCGAMGAAVDEWRDDAADVAVVGGVNDPGQDGIASSVAADASVDGRWDETASARAFGGHAEIGQDGAAGGATVGALIDGEQVGPAMAATAGEESERSSDIAVNPATLIAEQDVARVLSEIAETQVSLHVHHFAGNGRHVLVVWTSDRPGRGNADALNVLSGMRVQIVDLVGRHMDELSVGPEPIYIELTTAFSPL